MKILLILILLGALNFRCIQTEKASVNFIQLRNQKAPTSNTSIKFSGVYHHINEDSYHYPTDYKNGMPTRYIDSPYLDQPIFFFENGILLHEYRTTTLVESDISLSDEKSKKNFYEQKGWGVYNVNHDTINAIIYVDFLRGWFYTVSERLQCNFQGVIKNSDTILQWHLIPPFPNVNKKKEGNINFLESLKKGIDMYFKEIPEKKLIDPTKAWINNLQNKKTLLKAESLSPVVPNNKNFKTVDEI